MLLVSSSLEKHKVLKFRGEAQASEIAQAVRQWTRRGRVCRGQQFKSGLSPSRFLFFFLAAAQHPGSIQPGGGMLPVCLTSTQIQPLPGAHRIIKKRQKENIGRFPLPRANTVEAPHTRILGLKKCDLKLCGAPVHACAARQFASCVCCAIFRGLTTGSQNSRPPEANSETQKLKDADATYCSR
jgi:hypothetical protein